MAIKAGRVGVNPADVDPVNGHISPESVDSYTKAQADAKFETQTNASTEYAKLQPKTLAVPISMLQGSLLVPITTVEDVIQTMDNAMTNAELSEVKEATLTYTSGDDQNGYLKKLGRVVDLCVRLNDVTISANGVLTTLPVGYRPTVDVQVVVFNTTDGSLSRGWISSQSGELSIVNALTNKSIRLQANYIV